MIVAVELNRKKRNVPVKVQPISATVELVLILDYSIWLKFHSLEIRAENALNKTTNMILYFTHLAEMVS